MSEKFPEFVAVYNPGAIVGVRLRQCCPCFCHRKSGVMHVFPCCILLPEFDHFPTPDEQLPACPYCRKPSLLRETDETVKCLACNWKLVRGSQIGITS